MKDINKDIENLEEIINLINKELDKKDKNVSAILDLKDLLSLRNLIKEYKNLEEENIQLEACKDEVIRRYNFESIPVSLAEEKIEEYKKHLPDTFVYEQYNNEGIYRAIGKQTTYGVAIQVLQELLEKR
ncbi:MAG: hypothetical protein ACI4VC_05075 [Clostridia bacterium]